MPRDALGREPLYLLGVAAEIPAAEDWLAPREREVLAGLRFPKRRGDWLLGRWTAKRLLGVLLGVRGGPPELRALEIRAAEDGAPEAYRAGARLPLGLSISHRAGLALAAVAVGDTRIGCDLERVEARDQALLDDFFTAGEQAWVERGPRWDREQRIALVWSAKESALKTLREGLRLDTRSVEVQIGGADRQRVGWRRLRVIQTEDARVLFGWWRREADQVLTLVRPCRTGAPRRVDVESARAASDPLRRRSADAPVGAVAAPVQALDERREWMSARARAPR